MNMLTHREVSKRKESVSSAVGAASPESTHLTGADVPPSLPEIAVQSDGETEHVPVMAIRSLKISGYIDTVAVM